MPLQKIADFFKLPGKLWGNDIKGMSVYTQVNNEKIGTVSDIIVDDQGQLSSYWLRILIFGKSIAASRSYADRPWSNRVYAIGMTREQAEALPEFPTDLKTLIMTMKSR